MRHRVAGRKLGRPTGERVALLRSLAASLIIHEKIVTTEARAKETRSLAEKMITYGKRALYTIVAWPQPRFPTRSS